MAWEGLAPVLNAGSVSHRSGWAATIRSLGSAIPGNWSSDSEMQI